jgi:hypothetical protein
MALGFLIHRPNQYLLPDILVLNALNILVLFSQVWSVSVNTSVLFLKIFSFSLSSLSAPLRKCTSETFSICFAHWSAICHTGIWIHVLSVQLTEENRLRRCCTSERKGLDHRCLSGLVDAAPLLAPATSYSPALAATWECSNDTLARARRRSSSSAPSSTACSICRPSSPPLASARAWPPPYSPPCRPAAPVSPSYCWC